jgi:3-hydroxyacyl-[acyl-carrier-protein] dehydratase
MNDNLVNIEEIKNCLPHRYPFLLIDRVLSYTQNSVQALKNVTANEPFFSGHFPQMAVMPGVLQVEAMAQAAGLIIALDKKFDRTRDIALLAGIDNAKFRRIVVPGDQLILHAEIVAHKAGVLKVEARALVMEQVASSANITLVMKPGA